MYIFNSRSPPTLSLPPFLSCTPPFPSFLALSLPLLFHLSVCVCLARSLSLFLLFLLPVSCPAAVAMAPRKTPSSPLSKGKKTVPGNRDKLLKRGIYTYNITKCLIGWFSSIGTICMIICFENVYLDVHFTLLPLQRVPTCHLLPLATPSIQVSWFACLHTVFLFQLPMTYWCVVNIFPGLFSFILVWRCVCSCQPRGLFHSSHFYLCHE